MQITIHNPVPSTRRKYYWRQIGNSTQRAVRDDAMALTSMASFKLW